MLGILYDNAYPDHSLFDNFGLALKNYFGEYKHVKCVNDLDTISSLIIVDEHLASNVAIWKNNEFIEKINNKNLRTIIFNFEKIYSSEFPWNEDHQKTVESINNLYQFFSDIDDSKRHSQLVINKQFLSKDISIKRDADKKNKILFLGQSSGSQYNRRTRVLNIFRENLPDDKIDIIDTRREYTYNEYLDLLSQYKYILNPLGTGKFINLRFYEALELGCIPIQEIVDDMEDFYDELKYSITFKDFNDFAKKGLDTVEEYKNIYLEDYFNKINLKKYLID